MEFQNDVNFRDHKLLQYITCNSSFFITILKWIIMKSNFTTIGF